MKLQKQVSRRTKTKAYAKWDLTLPNGLIEELGWKAGDEISIKNDNAQLVLTRNNYAGKKINKTGEIDELSFFEKFFLVYSNLPLPERKMPVVVINDQPISWQMAYKEIRQKTRLGKKIGSLLLKLGVI